MTDETEDLEIEIEADPVEAPVEVIEAEPPKKAKKAKEPEQAAEPVEDPELVKLKQQIEVERQQTADAKRREAEAARREAEARGQTQDSQVVALEAHLTTTKQSIDVLKANYAEAMRAGDYDAAAEAQAELATQAARRINIETGIENAKNRPKPQPAAVDPVEQLATQLTPRSASWVRSHPEYARDTSLYANMISAHNLTMSRGIAPDSDAYFQSIESMLGVGQPIETTPLRSSEPEPAPQRHTAPPAAPVSRETNGVNGTPSKRVVRLTAEEREIARNMDMTDQEYARQKMQIEEDRAAGRIQ